MPPGAAASRNRRQPRVSGRLQGSDSDAQAALLLIHYEHETLNGLAHVAAPWIAFLAALEIRALNRRRFSRQAGQKAGLAGMPSVPYSWATA